MASRPESARGRTHLGALYVRAGRFDEARRLYREAARDLAGDRPAHVAEAMVVGAGIELAAGDAVICETMLRAAERRMAEAGSKRGLGDVSALLARALYEQGRFEEAASRADEALTRGIDELGQWDVLGVKALVLAHRGDTVTAERLAREAFGRLADTEALTARSQAALTLAHVLALAGRADEGRPVAEEALRVAQRKEDIVTARRARELLETLGAAATPPRSRARPSARR
jgi:tetratricopeptide (TPR) repeat protein